MKGLVKMSVVAASAFAISMALVACDQKPSSTSGGATSAPASSSGSGAKSLPGKVVETAKDVAGRASDASKAAAAAADNVGDAAKGAWADLRTAAASEGEKQLGTIKAKLKDLETTNPALFTSLNEAAKSVEGKIGELKSAGADTWQALADKVKAEIAEIQKKMGM